MAAPLRRIVLLHEFTGCLTNAAAIDGLETFLRGAELTDVRRAELAAVFLKSIEGVALPVANELRTRITEVAIACEKLCNALRQALAEPFHPEIRVTWAQNWVPSACIELRRVPPDIFRQILDVGSDQISNDWGKHICAVAERGLSLLRLWDCDGRLAPEKDSCLRVCPVTSCGITKPSEHEAD
jgi:hypothetical protein